MDTRRAVDIVVSTLAMPTVAFIAAALWATKRGNIFYRQQRTGLNGVPFTLIKFRTMEGAESLPVSQRVTRIGRFLRATGIDESPQFLNILGGDMSLIGPRPMPELEDNIGRAHLGTKKWDLRYQIPPGLVPPSAIYEKEGQRGYTNPKRRHADDMAYIEKRLANQSLKADLRLVSTALVCILKKRVDPQISVPAPSYPVKRHGISGGSILAR